MSDALSNTSSLSERKADQWQNFFSSIATFITLNFVTVLDVLKIHSLFIGALA